MNRIKKYPYSKTLFALGLALLMSVVAHAQNRRETRIVPDSVKNFELPSFNENTGVKEWDVFGDKAVYITDDQIDVDNIKLNVFEGAQTPLLKVSITSPRASVNQPERFVKSTEKIFANGEGFDIGGKKWSWDGRKKFVEIFSNVVIHFKSDSSSNIEDGVLGTPKKSGGDEKKPMLTTVCGNYASLLHGGKENFFSVKENVTVNNAQMSMSCDTLELESAKSSSDKIGKLTAQGNVNIRTGDRIATAQKAEIAQSDGIAVLTGAPQIEDTVRSAKLSGARIVMNRDKKEVESFSSQDGKTRAKTVILHTDSSGAQKTVNVSADTIAMHAQDGDVAFDFKGNVEIKSDGFTAYCDTMEAIAKKSGESQSNKIDVEKIRGRGHVKVVSDDGIATAKEFEANLPNQEIWLYENVKLRDESRGFKLDSDVLVFMQKQNSGMALTDKKIKDSFVVASLEQTPEIGRINDVKQQRKNGTQKSIIKSRILNFSRSDDNVVHLRFTNDVAIESADTNAQCQFMDVWGRTEKGATNIYKIEARNDVKVVQNDYTATAQLANIYPRVNESAENSDSKKAKVHRFIELLTAEDKPAQRPSITLPTIGNLGLNDEILAKKAKPQPTVIVSDKQWLTTSDDADKYFFSGNVAATGTDMNATCNQIEVVMRAPAKNAQKEIAHIIMNEDVKISQGLKDATCGRADIYTKEEMIILSREPVVRDREANTRATGTRMVYTRGKKGISIEGEDRNQRNPAESYDSDATAPQRPTIDLPSLGTIKKK